MPSFIQYQYGVLNEKVNAHKSVKNLLIQNNLLKIYQQFINSSLTDQDKDKDKDILLLNNSKRAKAIEDILKAYPKVVLHNAALLSISNAIQREVDKGQTEDEVIISIEQAVKDYNSQLDDVKYAKQACTWFDNGGYLSVVSKPAKKEATQRDGMDAVDDYLETIK